MKQIISLLILIIAIKSFSQESKIRIIDKEDNEGIPYVAIIISKPNEKSKISGVTNDDGYFILDNVSGKYHISISSLGYKKIEEDIVFSQKLVVFTMSQIVEDLEEVVIAGSKSFIQVKPGKLIVNISKSPLASSGSTWEALKYAPLVSTERSSITVLNKAAVVFIDGKRSHYNGEELQDYLNSLPANSIDQIEVIDSPGASYGSDVAAVINIRTKKLREYGLKGNIGLSEQNRVKPSYNTDVNLDYKRDKLSLRGRYSYSYNDFKYTNEVSNGTHNIDDVNNINKVYQNINFQSLLDIHSHTNIDFRVGFSLSEADNVGKSTFRKKSNLNQDYRGRTEISNKSFFLGVFTKLDSIQTLKIRANYLSNRQDYDVSLDIDKKPVFKEVIPSKTPISTVSVDYIRSQKNGEISAGVRYSKVSVENDNHFFNSTENSFIENLNRSLLFEYDEQVLAAYIEKSFMWKKYNFKLGFRAEKTMIERNSTRNNISAPYTDNYINYFPSVVINKRDTKGRVWNLSFRSGILRPNYSLLNPYSKFNGDITFFAGESKISPELRYKVSFYRYYKGLLSYFDVTSLNFISTYYRDNDGTLEQVYRNFEKSIFLQTHWSYNKKLYKFWSLTLDSGLFYPIVGISDIEVMKSSISYAGKIRNAFYFENNWSFDVSYKYNSAYKDGLFKHHENSSLDIAIRKKIISHPPKNTFNSS